jgi:hypothetical protein
LDPDKRKIIQRIIREAKERVETIRKEENKKRSKKGINDIYYIFFKKKLLFILTF